MFDIGNYWLIVATTVFNLVVLQNSTFSLLTVAPSEC